ncbi:hypothetical protein GE061_010064 [Apolygus lucorum]|uniref:Endonuclease/exonuclease/phosphatase domain-containing protein n=1 Tax=Apolygus lucorum TaxID=248454 RepID=A0A8S9Y208_APOLU|nr:hypothetical protein GE061_010064 [Apolygus lucorum]
MANMAENMDRQYGRQYGLEQVFARLDSSGFNLIVGCVYIPPDSHPEVYKAHTSFVQQLTKRNPDTSLFLMGDYNLPRDDIRGDPDGWLASSTQGLAVIEDFSFLNLRQVNFTPNSLGSILDLVFTNLPDCEESIVVDYNGSLVDCDRYHPSVSVILDIEDVTYEQTNVPPSFNFKKADFSKLRSYLEHIDWSCICGLDLDNAVEVFYSVLFFAIMECVPTVSASTFNFPQWTSQELRNLIKLKRIAIRPLAI